MKRAFTLIELLVVIAIIAILAAILFPVFARAKQAAKRTAGLAQMKQIGTAVQIYAADFDDGLPTWNICGAAANNASPLPASCGTSWVGPLSFAAANHWDALLYPYVKNGRPDLSDYSGLWQSPGAEYPVQLGRSLGINQLIFWKIDNFTSGGQCLGPSTNPFTGCYTYYNQSQVTYPARTMFTADTGKAGRYEPIYFLNGWAETWDGTYANYRAYSWSTPWRYDGEGANYTWLDSHAKFHKGDQIYPNPGHNKTLAQWTSTDIGKAYCSAATYQAADDGPRQLLINRAATNGVNCSQANQ